MRRSGSIQFGMHSTPTDEALVADFLVTRHERPFTLLYKRYCRKVYRSCLRLLGDPHQAQDQAQEIFIKVYARLDTFQGKAKFSTWLFTITRYHCLALLAKQRPTRLVTLSPDMEFWKRATSLPWRSAGNSSSAPWNNSLPLTGTCCGRSTWRRKIWPPWPVRRT
ncbi:sigma-70 family RNA polymerase sigma factor [Fibrella sp. HMF5405]|uniref:Sigma-70 family RNA polymerase sigma factor n=1 Tax=Fibrella forsythiae TaxID=2817061 RepID=A0ABS3JTG9_9BACT|nr:sigma-70 family RNA polymerase sigma factor [Fibrella forsythiae]